MGKDTQLPVTESEALREYQALFAFKNADALRKYEKATGRNRTNMEVEEIAEAGVRPVPEALPEHDDVEARELYTLRVPMRIMAYVRARSAKEGRKVSDVIFEAMEAYAESAPHTYCVYTEQPDQA